MYQLPGTLGTKAHACKQIVVSFYRSINKTAAVRGTPYSVIIALDAI